MNPEINQAMTSEDYVTFNGQSFQAFASRVNKRMREPFSCTANKRVCQGPEDGVKIYPHTLHLEKQATETAQTIQFKFSRPPHHFEIDGVPIQVPTEFKAKWYVTNEEAKRLKEYDLKIPLGLDLDPIEEFPFDEDKENIDPFNTDLADLLKQWRTEEEQEEKWYD